MLRTELRERPVILVCADQVRIASARLTLSKSLRVGTIGCRLASARHEAPPGRRIDRLLLAVTPQ
jgi:hypothetical protein